MSQRNITGSLQTKNDTYYAVINTYVDGKRKQKWVNLNLPTKGNKKRAEAALREQLIKFQKLSMLVSTDMTFSDYIEVWLENEKDKIDIITFETYEKLVKIHISPYFAERKIKLCDISAEELQIYFNIKQKFGRKDGNGGLSACSLRKHKNILNQVLKSAVKKGYIARNYCEDLDLPALNKHQARFYSKEQALLLLKASKDEKIYPMICMALFYGMRRSEICGLQWDAINYSEKTITIKHTLVKHTSLVAKDKTKTESSHRSYPINDEIEEMLNRIKEEQSRNKKLMGKSYNTTPYIFTWENGKPITPDYLSHKFAKIIKKNNLPQVSIHGLRHSCASLLLSQGQTLKDVQEWLGHADISMTANIYGHLDIKRKQTIAECMTSLISVNE